MNDAPEEAGTTGSAVAATEPEGTALSTGSVSFCSSSERKGFSPDPTRPISGGSDAEPRNHSKRPATLRSASSGGPAASGAGRASRPDGSETTGGAVAVRFVDAASCGALGCRRSDQLVAVDVEGDRRVLCLPHARRWVR